MNSKFGKFCRLNWSYLSLLVPSKGLYVGQLLTVHWLHSHLPWWKENIVWTWYILVQRWQAIIQLWVRINFWQTRQVSLFKIGTLFSIILRWHVTIMISSASAQGIPATSCIVPRTTARDWDLFFLLFNNSLTYSYTNKFFTKMYCII